jgi:hypothetical protein
MKTLYACTYVEKDVEVDSFAHGCDPRTRTCVMAERVDLTSDTLPGLLQTIGHRFGLDLEDIWAPEEELTWIGYNRLEDGAGNEPTREQKRLWRRGQETLYLADYRLAVEKRTVAPLSRREFAGVQHHE